MATSSRPLGLRSTPELAIPQFSNWTTQLRVVEDSDSSPSSVAAAERIDLDKNGDRVGSRFSLNTIALLVKLIGSGSSAVITLYVKNGSDYFIASDPQSVESNQMLVFKDLPPLTYVPVVTSLVGTVEISGGGTL